MALKTLKTEQEHLRELVDAISAAVSYAAKLTYEANPGKRNQARIDFADQMKRATTEAEALNFYRNQVHWGMIAVCLDQASKSMVAAGDWPKTAELLEALGDKVLKLANQRRN